MLELWLQPRESMRNYEGKLKNLGHSKVSSSRGMMAYMISLKLDSFYYFIVFWFQVTNKKLN